MGRKEDKLKKDTPRKSSSLKSKQQDQEEPVGVTDGDSMPRSLRSRQSGTGVLGGAKPSSIKTNKLTSKTPQKMQQDDESSDSGSCSDSDIDPEIEDLARAVAHKIAANTSNTNISTKNMTKDKKKITSQPLFVIDTGPVKQKDYTNDESDTGDDDNDAEDIDESDDGRSSSDDETELNVAVTTHVKQDLHLADAAVTKETEKEGFTLSSELQAGFNRKQMYVNVDAYTKPKQNKKVLKDLLLSKKKDKQLMEKSVLTADYEKKFAVPPYQESLNQLKKKNRLEREKTKGKGWFNLPAPEMDDQKKNDLMVIQMRRALDPKRFYKGPDLKALPKYFQMGTVVEGPADFYNSRVPKKQRKATLVDELLADAQFRQFNKRKYAEIVEHQARSRGPQKHMKRLKRSKKGK